MPWLPSCPPPEPPKFKFGHQKLTLEPIVDKWAQRGKCPECKSEPRNPDFSPHQDEKPPPPPRTEGPQRLLRLHLLCFPEREIAAQGREGDLSESGETRPKLSFRHPDLCSLLADPTLAAILHPGWAVGSVGTGAGSALWGLLLDAEACSVPQPHRGLHSLT
jgi:hypothetical protein